MYNLSIERIWEDTGFFEIEVFAQSKLASGRIKTYIPNGGLDDLALVLVSFPKNFSSRYFWEAGGKGEDPGPYVSFEFWCEDKLGHIIIEIYMDINDGAVSKHNCCFYIKTEAGFLNKFGTSLPLLNECGIGKKITLHQMDD